MIRKITVLFLIALLLGSCASRKKIVYLQNISKIGELEKISYEPKIKPDDQLVISVYSSSPEAVVRFNLNTTQLSATEGVRSASAMVQPAFTTYLVDYNGEIQFPIIGAIKIGGLSKSEAIAKVKNELLVYVKDPVVTMRILNFKVSVQGEVNKPGAVSLATERITLPEAISGAGDITIYGRRDNVLIVREVDGQKTYNYIDMTKADYINSPFYYLTQNDLVVVEPNKVKMNSSAVGPNIAVIFSSISLLITIITIATR